MTLPRLPAGYSRVRMMTASERSFCIIALVAKAFDSIVIGLFLLAAGTAAASGDARVVPIDFQRFDASPAADADLDRAAALLRNSARYQLQWAPRAAERIETGWRELTGRQAHDVIRPACESAHALAVFLKFDAGAVPSTGIDRQEALARTIRLIRAAAKAHDGRGWKYPWQSSFWAALLGEAGWLLWDDLDPATRGLLVQIVEFEADRFLDPGYHVPYWNIASGDTKAEENAWDSMIHHVAVAMMPAHPHAARWKTVASELMVSAYARREDLSRETSVDGRPVRQWLRGYNVRDDGAVINHNILHPDYMTCTNLKMRAYLVLPLGGRMIPQSAAFGVESVYRTLAAHRWPSPPYKSPGGTIYVPGQAEVYFPEGTDWYAGRLDVYYLADGYAAALGWCRDLEVSPRDWFRLRAGRLLAQQSRHSDGRLYADNEFRNFPGREQGAAWVIADAFLLEYLRTRNALDRVGNWHQEP